MKDIRIGFIGLGGRGYGLLEWAVLPQKEQVVAVYMRTGYRRAPSW